VTPTGGRLWRFRYRHGGVEKLLTLGAYPDVSLKRAREKRDDARQHVADGVDPSAKRQAERKAAADTFVAIIDEWLLTKKNSLTPATWERDHNQLHKWVVPYLGNRPISAIEAPELLAVLKRIESKGVIDTAHVKSADVYSGMQLPRAALHATLPRIFEERLRRVRPSITRQSLIL
jgi:Arm DNA-binding domain/Phage integrase, N-terminal SAM-like domain